ncbi:hypothetical protein [Amycolatopsis minnesotensis]|uniref:Uncharacterized protein n=1 Tax=Amycolatopsis minnesotensis TaxID=337894 RepID=A0ABP5DQR9_9PSEU
MTRYENYEYEPAARPRAVRDLVRALGVPDEVPLAVPDERLVVIETLDRPDGSLTGDQIVIGIDTAAEANLSGRIGNKDTVLHLEGDFAAGTYERDVDEA